ncbi:zinc finger CCCH domain-containing protein 13-like [Gigantopelta aegis]|uniref:zinc finger CCCH domain-containing protein 13-like n=1 Tax=Gigantopelta aegis TaxID=1735272 RepID=UPI001B888D47|nr:zinc finger CCCH domain-containing protein 13-like [Gigantopelta aegis]
MGYTRRETERQAPEHLAKRRRKGNQGDGLHQERDGEAGPGTPGKETPKRKPRRWVTPGERRRGRPRNTWQRDAEKETKEMGYTRRETERQAPEHLAKRRRKGNQGDGLHQERDGEAGPGTPGKETPKRKPRRWVTPGERRRGRPRNTWQRDAEKETKEMGYTRRETERQAPEHLAKRRRKGNQGDGLHQERDGEAGPGTPGKETPKRKPRRWVTPGERRRGRPRNTWQRDAEKETKEMGYTRRETERQAPEHLAKRRRKGNQGDGLHQERDGEAGPGTPGKETPKRKPRRWVTPGERRRGRPRNTWQRDAEKETKEMGYTRRETERQAPEHLAKRRRKGNQGDGLHQERDGEAGPGTPGKETPKRKPRRWVTPGERRRGRPRNTWQRDAEKETKEMGYTRRETERQAPEHLAKRREKETKEMGYTRREMERQAPEHLAKRRRKGNQGDGLHQERDGEAGPGTPGKETPKRKPRRWVTPGERWRGRPRNTWQRDAEKETKEMGYTRRETEKMATKRQQ